MLVATICLVILVSALATTQSIRSPNSRIVDSLKRFPHHVTIEAESQWNRQGNHRICAGSILNERWILTSAFCVDESDQLQIHFEKLYELLYNGSYTIVVNKDAIYRHPTLYYDIALINLPILLNFSDTLKPIEISSSPESSLEWQFAVMPSFSVQKKPVFTTTTTSTTVRTSTTTTTTERTTPSTTADYTTGEYSSTTISPTYSTPSSTSSTVETSTVSSTPYPTTPTTEAQLVRSKSDATSQLIYGMFRILPSNVCKALNYEFDEFLQICTENWISSNDATNQCWNHGSALLSGWPRNPKIVGIFSTLLNSCNSSQPLVYTNAVEYLPWIMSIIDIPAK